MNITTSVGYRMSLDPKTCGGEGKPPTAARAQDGTGIPSGAERRSRTSGGAERELENSHRGTRPATSEPALETGSARSAGARAPRPAGTSGGLKGRE